MQFPHNISCFIIPPLLESPRVNPAHRCFRIEFTTDFFTLSWLIFTTLKSSVTRETPPDVPGRPIHLGGVCGVAAYTQTYKAQRNTKKQIVTESAYPWLKCCASSENLRQFSSKVTFQRRQAVEGSSCQSLTVMLVLRTIRMRSQRLGESLWSSSNHSKHCWKQNKNAASLKKEERERKLLIYLFVCLYVIS